jgi:curved DNA-binding protein CbpA
VTPLPVDIERCYDVLKVPRDASPLAIRKAYRVLSQKHHPDRNREDPHAADRMAEINQAYAVLCDARRKIEHDAWTVQHSGGAERVAPRATRPRRKKWWYFTGAALVAIAIGCVMFTPTSPQDAWLGHAWHQSSASTPAKATPVTDVEIADRARQQGVLLNMSLSLRRGPARDAGSPPAAQGLP